jgi:hypothetical protein
MSGLESVGGNMLGGMGKLAGDMGGGLSSLFGLNPGAGAMNGSPGASAAAAASPAGTGVSGSLPGMPTGGGSGLSVAGAGGLPSIAPSLAADGPNADSFLQSFSGFKPADPSAIYTGDPTLKLDRPASAMAQGATNAADGLNAHPITGATPHVGGMQGLLQQLMTPKGAMMGMEAGMIGKNLFGGDSASLKSLKHMQSDLAGRAKQLGAASDAEKLGHLPQPAQDIIDRSVQQRIAQIRQQYASAGLSGSSAEAQDIAAAQQDGVMKAFEIGQGMASQGISEMQTDLGSSAGLLQAIMQQEAAQGTELGTLLAKFAGLTAQ